MNGGQATLGQVVDFYSHRGDFPSADMDPNLERASFGTLDKLAVVAFLKSLTDERVRNQSAPFDHPSLTVPNGGSGDQRNFDGTDNHYPSYRRRRRSAHGQVLRFIGRRVFVSLPVKRFVRFVIC